MNTRQTVVRRVGHQLAVEDCLGLRGAPCRTALRIIMKVQQGLVQHVEYLLTCQPIGTALRLPEDIAGILLRLA